MKHTTIVLTALLFASCTHEASRINDIEIINLNDAIETDDLSLFEESVEKAYIVPLETNDDVLIRDITKLSASDERIVIFDKYNTMNQIHIFDKDGKWIASSQRGQGPGEIVHAYDMAFDTKDNVVIVNQHSKNSIFDHNFTFVKDVERDWYCLNIASFNGKQLYLLSNSQAEQQKEKFQNNKIIVFDKQSNTKQTYHKVCHKYDIIFENNLCTSKDGVSYKQFLCDTIYQYNGDSYGPRYVLEYPSKTVLGTNIENDQELSDIFNTLKGFFFNGQYTETDEHQFVRITSHKDMYIYAYRDKRNGRTRSIKTIPKNNHVLSIPHNSFKDYFVTIMDYNIVENNISFLKKMVSQEEYNILSNMKEEDNPILLFYQLKDF